MTLHEKELKEALINLSHDLKANFRHIDEFFKIFLEDMAEKDKQIIAENQENIDFINLGVNKGKNLLQNFTIYRNLFDFKPKKEEIKISNYLKKWQQENENLISEKNITIEKSLSCDEISFDPENFHLLINEILSNAIIYNDNPPLIKIDSKIKNNKKSLSFTDNGIGIKQQYIPKLFAATSRVEPSYNKSGSGMGLTIVKKICDLNNYNIEIFSTEENGTTVTITEL